MNQNYHPYVIDPGHVYELPQFLPDGMLDPFDFNKKLVFLKRSGGTIQHANEHQGTNVQSVIRILIDRTKYLDALVPCVENADTLYHLRMALVCYEGRAWRRKLDKVNRGSTEHQSFRERDRDLPFDDQGFIDGERVGIENLPIGPDGHILISDPE